MSVERILELFGVQAVKDMRKSYYDEQRKKGAKYGRGFNENSNLGNSIKFDVRDQGDAVVFELKMSDYWDVINKGRRPGPVSQEGQEKIKYWIRKVNIKPATPMNYEKFRTGLAFAIAMKISRVGFKGTNFYDKIIHDGRLDKLKADLKEEIKKDIIIEFKK